jgi:hypothetical protein
MNKVIGKILSFRPFVCRKHIKVIENMMQNRAIIAQMHTNEHKITCGHKYSFQ